MKKILIIGYGNPLRSDDGIGWRAAEELSEHPPSAGVKVLVCYQLTPELSDDVRQSNAVIFIDAARDGEPGELTVTRVSAQGNDPFSHELSPAAVLELSRRLYHCSPTAFMVSLCGEHFEHGEILSKKVKARFPHLISLVCELARAKYP
jgi:hydrogenase maturation protease